MPELPPDHERRLRARAERVVASLPKVTFEPSLVSQPEPLSPWHEAAAVLSTFQIRELHPPSPTDVPRETLLLDCTMTSQQQRRWTLRSDVRVRALRQLRTREQMSRALAVNPLRSDDALQRILEAIIRGESLRIDRLGLAELSAASQAAEWFDTILDGLPSRQAIIDRLDYLRLLESFEHLVGDHFHGRKKELAQLSDYVGALSAESFGEAILRGLEATVLSYERAPLMIVAVGGAGKSTLIAKFLLDHARAAEEERFPFAYLDFDRPSIFAEEPVSILIEAVRQIGIEYAHAREDCEKLRRHWQSEFQMTGWTDDDRTHYRRLRAVRELAQLIRSLDAEDKPLLLVLDTFEEVQYGSSRYIDNLWSFIRMTQGVLPRVRFVLAGRAPLSGIDVQQLDLPDLEETAAEGFLKQRGIPADVAATVVKQVGRNPLSLRLAAAVLHEEQAGEEGIRGLATGRRRLKTAEIQGHLFKRILDHIHDDDVRRLAYPGLALRRITPMLIEQVLAQTCGVHLDSESRANELFDELGREMSLVTPAADGGLVHRGDVRRLMLPMLEASDPERMRLIEESAIRFYQPHSDAASRAEEIYHRLRLGQKREVINARWMDGVESYLRSAVEEMTPSGRLLLAEHGVGPSPDREMIRNASQEEWERAAKIEAEDALANGDPTRALKAIRERKARLPASELRLLEARVLLALRELKEAREVSKQAIDDYAQSDGGRLLFKSYLVSAEAAMYGEDYAYAEEALGQARLVAEELGDKAGLLAVDVLHVTLDDARLSDPSDVLSRLRVELDQTEDFVLAARPELLRDAVRILGATQPDVVARALRVVGFAAPPESGWRTLVATCLRSAYGRIRASLPRDSNLASRLEEIDERAGSSWQRYGMSAQPGELASWLADVLDLAAGEAQLVALLRDGVTRVETSTGSSTEWTIETLGALPEPEGKRDRARMSSAGIREVLELSRRAPIPFTGPQLDRMLNATMHRSLAAISRGPSVEQIFSDVIRVANLEGWVQEFAVASARWWPDSELILRLADQVGGGVAVADWSDRKLPDRLLRERRSELARIDRTLCAITLRRRPIGSGLLVAPDVVVTASDTESGFLDQATFKFPAALGMVTVTAKRVIAEGGSIFVIRLSESPGEHLIDGAGSLQRGVIPLDRRDDDVDEHLAVWRDDMSRMTIAAVGMSGYQLRKKDAVPRGAVCFDDRLRFSGIAQPNVRRIVPPNVVSEIVQKALAGDPGESTAPRSI